MFGYFYPENGERFLASLSFATVQEAIDYFRDKRATWEVVKAFPPDMTAFLNPRTGDIVVVREITAA